MECKPEFKTLRSRLDTYGLADREKQLVDITLEANQEWKILIEDPQAQEHIVTLQPQSPYDLKKWIGIPDHAYAVGLRLYALKRILLLKSAPGPALSSSRSYKSSPMTLRCKQISRRSYSVALPQLRSRNWALLRSLSIDRRLGSPFS